MTNEELIKLGKSEILTKYKQLYIERFRAVFGYKPACASCSFRNDFAKFRNKISNFQNGKPTKIKTMENKQEYRLIPRYRSQILSYINKDKKVVRIYGRDLTDDFAKEYLKNGSKDQIEKRKAMFAEIPTTKKVESKVESKEETENSEENKTTSTAPKTKKKRKGKK